MIMRIEHKPKIKNLMKISKFCQQKKIPFNLVLDNKILKNLQILIIHLINFFKVNRFYMKK